MAAAKSTTTPRWVRGLHGVLVAALAAYLVWTIPGVRPSPGFDVAFDGVLQGSSYVLIAALAVLATVRIRRSRVWWLLSAALCLRAIGFVLELSFLSAHHPLGSPSVADGAWVLSSACLIGAVVLRVAERAPRMGVFAALDGLGLSTVVVGFAVTVLAKPIETFRHQGVPRAEVITNIGYPVLDTVLLVAVATLMTSVRLRLKPAEILLIIGAVAFSTVDIVYVVLLTEGTWHPGSMLASFSLIATAVLAYSIAVAPDEAGTRTQRLGEEPAAPIRPTIVMPVLIASLSVVGLVIAGLADTPQGSSPIYGIAGVLALIRGILTLQGDRREAGVVLGATTSDLRRFKALIEASTNLIGIADVEGRVLYLNPAGRQMLKLPSDADVSSLTAGQLLGNQARPELDNTWSALLERGSWQGESQVVPVDGSEPIPVGISSFTIRDPATQRPVAVATIQRDIRELLRAEADVRALADQRAALLGRLVEAQEEERTRIAADVHDDPVQALAAVDLRLGMLRRRIAEQAPDLLDTVDVVRDAVVAATDRLRNLLFDLEPPSAEDGLGNALAAAADFIFAGTPVRWQITGDHDLTMPGAELATAYRITKEALVNACKHAGANRVVVDISRLDDGVQITVTDDGCGIDPDAETRARRGHRGLSSMRDRAQIAGGTLEVGPGEAGGTQVRLWLPLATT